VTTMRAALHCAVLCCAVLYRCVHVPTYLYTHDAMHAGPTTRSSRVPYCWAGRAVRLKAVTVVGLPLIVLPRHGATGLASVPAASECNHAVPVSLLPHITVSFLSPNYSTGISQSCLRRPS
jgi:hypothetical protein